MSSINKQRNEVILQRNLKLKKKQTNKFNKIMYNSCHKSSSKLRKKKQQKINCVQENEKLKFKIKI